MARHRSLAVAEPGPCVPQEVHRVPHGPCTRSAERDVRSLGAVRLAASRLRSVAAAGRRRPDSVDAPPQTRRVRARRRRRWRPSWRPCWRAAQPAARARCACRRSSACWTCWPSGCRARGTRPPRPPAARGPRSAAPPESVSNRKGPCDACAGSAAARPRWHGALLLLVKRMGASPVPCRRVGVVESRSGWRRLLGSQINTTCQAAGLRRGLDVAQP